MHYGGERLVEEYQRRLEGSQYVPHKRNLFVPVGGPLQLSGVKHDEQIMPTFGMISSHS